VKRLRSGRLPYLVTRFLVLANLSCTRARRNFYSGENRFKQKGASLSRRAWSYPRRSSRCLTASLGYKGVKPSGRAAASSKLVKRPCLLEDSLRRFAAVEVPMPGAISVVQAFFEQTMNAVISEERTFPTTGEVFDFLRERASHFDRFVFFNDRNWSYLLSNSLQDVPANFSYAISRATRCKGIAVAVEARRRELHVFERRESVREIREPRRLRVVLSKCWPTPAVRGKRGTKSFPRSGDDLHRRSWPITFMLSREGRCRTRLNWRCGGPAALKWQGHC
jgi:hypothetical protein